ncbi:MAG: hypothetical protein QG641_1335 [Candidatus Poribacteria bacterium]|nr:hypothetical protein [Candidatus Poribacteria bacterium]
MSFPRRRESSFHAVFMDSSLRWNDRLLDNFLFLSSVQFSFLHSTRKNLFLFTLLFGFHDSNGVFIKLEIFFCHTLNALFRDSIYLFFIVRYIIVSQLVKLI